MMFGLNCAILIRAFEIKSCRKDTYNRQYQTFSQKPDESLDDCFARFESIVSSLYSCGPLHILIMNVLNNCCMLLMIMCALLKLLLWKNLLILLT
jgi:hypothetical protein